ncbi:MAG: HAMP domain-containing protein [Spirirestis rafaelensis WJT71-NPBG6]|jgi:nitrogen fixation/metabolism regulation signal transduction histidine kinase|nr:HAMP domain-containing protein [Spirirestis rafaelensis WJT71-NPBG6]
MMESARRINAGETDAEVEVKSLDEFGQLATEINLIVNKLRQIRDRFWYRAILLSRSVLFSRSVSPSPKGRG